MYFDCGLDLLALELASVARLVRQFIGNIVKNISMDDPYVLQILDPWSLMYGEYEDDFIEVLRRRIGPKHPLYNREVYAVAIRRDPEATLFHAYKDGFYAVVYFSAVPGGRSGMPKTEIFPDDRAVGEKIAADHAEQLEQYKRGQAN